MYKFKPSKRLTRLKEVFIIDETSDAQLDFASEATQYIEHLEKTLENNGILIPVFVKTYPEKDNEN